MATYVNTNMGDIMPKEVKTYIYYKEGNSRFDGYEPGSTDTLGEYADPAYHTEHESHSDQRPGCICNWKCSVCGLHNPGGVITDPYDSTKRWCSFECKEKDKK
jgi:hypothetical protein